MSGSLALAAAWPGSGWLLAVLSAASLACAVTLLLPPGATRLRRAVDRAPRRDPAGPRRWRTGARSERRAHDVAAAQAPQVLELLAACVAAGLPVRSACRTVAASTDSPLADELSRVAALAGLGASDADAWAVLHDHPVLGPAAADLSRCVDTGTRVVECLRQHAAQAREEQRSALQVRARGVGVRSVLPLMTCFLPSFLLLGVVPSVASAVARAFG